MKKKNFLMMLGLLGFGVTANAQVVASLGFEEGEEQKYLNPDSVDKYPDWSADHINLGKEDVWNEDYTDDVHSGTYALQVNNAGMSWSNSATGNAWDRGLKLRGLNIEPGTSYRVSFWAKAPATYQSADGASTGVTSIKSSLSIGIENLEAPWVSQSGTQYYYNWTGTEDAPVFEGDWKCFSFVSYYSGKDVQNSVFDNFNNNIKEVIENDPDDPTDNDTIYWGQEYTEFPDKFFLTINMYNPVEYLLDDIKIEKATMAGCFYDYNGIRIDFGYPTNLADLASASSDPVEGTILFPTEWVTVKYGDQVLTPYSLEGKPDGGLYIFFEEGYLEETIGFLGDDPEVVEGITVSFNPSADCPIKYDTDQRPSMDVESEMTVLPFTDEKLMGMVYFQEETYLNAAPGLVSTTPENRSFELDAASLTQLKLTYNRPVDVSMSSATLYSTDSGSEVAVFTAGSGLSVDPEDENTVVVTLSDVLADGGYRLDVINVMNAISGVFNYDSQQLAFSVGADQSTGTTETIYAPDFSAVENDVFPVGWVSYCSDGGVIHEYGVNDNGSLWNYNYGGMIDNVAGAGNGGSRMFGGFSGDFKKAIYWGSRGVSTAEEVSTLTFGAQVEDYYDPATGEVDPEMDPGIALKLEPKKHELSFLMAAWKGEPTFDFTLENLQGEVVAEFRDQLAKPNVNGVQGPVSGSLELVTEFTPPKEDYYVLKFATKPGIGWSELLLAQVRLITKPSDAAYYKSMLQAAVDSAQHVMTDSVANEIYNGATKLLLEAALAEATGTKYTSPSKVEAMTDSLYALCGKMLVRKQAVDRYDIELVNLQNALAAIDAASKYALTDEYVNGLELANNYLEVSSADLEDEELIAAVDDFVKNKGLVSNVKSCVDALTYRLTKTAETARLIGVEHESAILEAENALADDDALAEGMNGNIKFRLYQILAEDGTIAPELKDTIYSETVADETGQSPTGYQILTSGIDLTGYVKNPQFYSYISSSTDTITAENTPGWTLKEGYQVHVSWENGGWGATEVKPVADNRIHNTKVQYTVLQSVSGLPVGVYDVHMRTRTSIANAAGGTTFVMNAQNDETGKWDKYLWAVSSTAPKDTLFVPYEAGGIVYDGKWGGYPTVVKGLQVGEDAVLTFGVTEKYVSHKNFWKRDAWDQPWYPAEEDAGDWDTQTMVDDARLIFVAPMEGYDYTEGMVGVDDVKAAEPVSYEYYTVDGIKLERPAKGVNIVKTHYADGTVKVQTKIMK